MTTANNTLKVDWTWVRSELLGHERIRRGTILKCADECIKEARALVNPKIIHRMRKASSMAFSTKQISSYLKGADRVLIFLVTIGGRLEKEASRLMAKGKELKGYLLDRIGSLAVESLADAAEDHFRRDHAKRSQSVSARSSPGYCDWPVEDQRLLDKALDFSRAGVRLTENCMMAPKKSISAVLGVGPKGIFKKRPSPCVVCGIRDCSYRRY